MWCTFAVCLIVVCACLEPARAQPLTDRLVIAVSPSGYTRDHPEQQQQHHYQANDAIQTFRPQMTTHDQMLASTSEDNGAVVSPAVLHVDKRSWSPRALKVQSSVSQQQDEAISLLLEEVASLDIDAANESNARRAMNLRQQPAVDNSRGHQQQPQQPLMPGIRVRARSTGGSSGGGMPSFHHSDGTHGARRAMNKHLPCFFNAITCF